MKLSSKHYIMSDGKTHRYWWTWVPALPLSIEDKWYKVLSKVFMDRTTNCRSGSRWHGFYTERQENHQMVSIFQTFSAFADWNWAENILSICGIDFTPPLQSVMWQYQLQSPDNKLHADLTLAMVDGADATIALVVEGKRSGGAFKEKDLDGSYTRLPQISHCTKKEVVLLVEKSDLHLVPSYCRRMTYDDLADIQIKQINNLNIDPQSKLFLIDLLKFHLQWFGIPRKPTTKIDNLFLGTIPDKLDDRIASLAEGLKITLAARLRKDLLRPARFSDELSIEDYSNSKIKFDWSECLLY